MKNWESILHAETHLGPKKAWIHLIAQSVKNPSAMQEIQGSFPRSGRSPAERNGNPLQYSCLENSMDRGTWWDYSPWGRKSWT